MPYGSTSPKNLESLMNDMSHWPGARGPLFVFYDQEPILGEFNFELLDHVVTNYSGGDQFILVTTECNSDTLDLVKSKYNCPVVYYFHHVFAAHDWYRGYKFDARLIAPNTRQLKKKYIAFNRLTSGARTYRSLFVSELVQRGILDQGHVSYNSTCPTNEKHYVDNLYDAVEQGLITKSVAEEAITNIDSAPLPLRIDYKNQTAIPNNSMLLSAVPECMESFIYVVTETCYWEHKCHLTEKIFKPIVSRMPFVLVGCAHNLAYLRSYGFRTFDRWIDESYDAIEDPIERMHVIGQVLLDISNRSLDDLQQMLCEMQEVLDHNHRLFYSQELLDSCWNELVANINQAVGPT